MQGVLLLDKLPECLLRAEIVQSFGELGEGVLIAAASAEIQGLRLAQLQVPPGAVDLLES